ncbi:hypothetical protein BABINDRAFT_163512 [Babjeviella inositovora NRRL Y-12698]|uniref:Pre-mRNA-splicing factor 3 domain-containing protein n=1 Tax=Babjeviella inositovora NRRL Y-12698 TaxID=984486 RepID=A0A1E3QII1_9ASCO|nr:uncharacterized protein BABINDRAFT_163512 [Babjeviella inositovora NRRL Y-12698]ODQ77506.1 hypothetical protein BABINDRAFT_163512 [Babjeviella inositovora NRRL Y-12698]
MPPPAKKQRTGEPRSSSMSPELMERIAQAKARAASRQSEAVPATVLKAKGLNVEIHPLLRPNALMTIDKDYNPVLNPVLPIASAAGKTGPRDNFQFGALNPYLNQEDMKYAVKSRRKEKGLQFNVKGKYIAKAEELRAQLREESEARAHQELLKSQGLVADESVGENLFVPKMPPRVEWWDEPYLKQRSYGFQNETDMLENYIIPYSEDAEDPPITLYIQHPVPMPAPWETEAQPAKLYLTKKELKKLRKNNRTELDRERQDRIRLGLDPTPKPKIKLKNLMNVLTNESIKDPTMIEMQVQSEIEERRLTHLKENQARHAQALETKLEKLAEKNQKELDKGIFSCVVRVDRLVNPQHRFKLNINAKQLKLHGVMLVHDGAHAKLSPSNAALDGDQEKQFSLVIVEGAQKAINHFKKLIMGRIDWQENAVAKRLLQEGETDPIGIEIEDLSHNKCLLIWEGQVKDFHFQRWSSEWFTTDASAIEVLQRFRVENYWRDAKMYDMSNGD